jgi:hypothetical protein
MEPEPAQEPLPLHVGEEVHELTDAGHLLRPHGDEDEDRTVGAAADDVAEEAQAVLVGPLDVVEEDRQRADRGELGHGDRGEVIRAQQLLGRREIGETRVVAT